MSNAKAAGICILGLLATAALAVVLYLGSFALRGDTKNREVKIENRNTGVQTAWRDGALERIEEIEVLELTPGSSSAQAALADTACDLIGRLTDNYRSDPRIDAFAERYCQ